MRTFLTVILMLSAVLAISAQSLSSLSINGFTQWRTGHDDATEQLIPKSGNDPLVSKKGKVIAQVKFKIKDYGEMSFPIDPRTPEGEEARRVDLSNSKSITIIYKSTHELILQLRQTGVHGGTHNRIVLPASERFITKKIYFSEFSGGKAPLDLADVAKFNFAFLSNANKTPYIAELVVRSFFIDQYEPVK